MEDKDYTKKLETVIKQMLIPLKNIPLPLVIESISNHKVIPFDPENPKDIKLLRNLEKVALDTGKQINKRGILRTRPNEVGNEDRKSVV